MPIFPLSIFTITTPFRFPWSFTLIFIYIFNYFFKKHEFKKHEAENTLNLINM